MKINLTKTKVILFNKGRKYDFMPNVSVDGNQLQVVEEICLLGVLIKSDMRWNSNTENICRNAFSRLWIIKRLKNMGASEIDLLDVYQKHVQLSLLYLSGLVA